MHLDRLTDAAREALEAAFRRASELRHAAVEPEHLLAALVAAGDAPAAALLRGLEVPVDQVLGTSGGEPGSMAYGGPCCPLGP